MTSVVPRPPKPAPTLPSPALSETELNALYDELNRTRFGGAVPSYKVSLQEPGQGLTASCHPWFPSIFISPVLTARFNGEHIRRILLHEMCHVATKRDGSLEVGHGPLWRAAMLALRDQGEGWVTEDIALAAAADERGALIERMTGAMVKEIDRALPWRTVRGLLIRRFGRQATELLRDNAEPKALWKGLRQEGGPHGAALSSPEPDRNEQRSP